MSEIGIRGAKAVLAAGLGKLCGRIEASSSGKRGPPDIHFTAVGLRIAGRKPREFGQPNLRVLVTASKNPLFLRAKRPKYTHHLAPGEYTGGNTLKHNKKTPKPAVTPAIMIAQQSPQSLQFASRFAAQSLLHARPSTSGATPSTARDLAESTQRLRRTAIAPHISVAANAHPAGSGTGTTAIALPRALCIAVRTFDAWMLADERALSRVLGGVVPAQPDPENLRDAKSPCRDIRDASGTDPSLTQVYREVASLADHDLLKPRCPQGFRPFAERVRALRETWDTLAAAE